MVQIDSAAGELPESLHQIALFGAAQDGQLFTLFKLLEELSGAVERNRAINTVRNHLHRLRKKNTDQGQRQRKKLRVNTQLNRN